MLLSDVSNIGKDHRESDGKDSRHGNNRKVPPGRENGGKMALGSETETTMEGMSLRLVLHQSQDTEVI